MKANEGVVSNAFTGELVGFEWEGIDSFDHLSRKVMSMNDEAEQPPASATRKPKVAKYWTEVHARVGGHAVDVTVTPSIARSFTKSFAPWSYIWS